MTEVRTDVITREIIANAYSYNRYNELITRLLSQDRTTGENHSEAMLHYTLMNIHRMKRLNRQIELIPELIHVLESVNRNIMWLVLTEAWCGDAAQILPLFNKMADLNNRIELRLILRDEHPGIMDEFLYQGRSRSIPLLIALDSESLEVLGSWGPRPQEAQDLFEEMRSIPDTPYQEAAEVLHRWYASDRTESAQREFLEIIPAWISQ